MECPELPDVAEVTDVLTTRYVYSKGKKRSILDQNENLLHEIKKLKSISYICQICQKDFESEKYLSMHLSLHRSTVDASEVSLRRSPNLPQTLNNHNFQMSFSDEKLYCPVCFKTFTQNSNLKNHVKTHSEDRPFICDICSIGFKERYHLKKHILFKHTQDSNQSCRFCNKKFKDATAVRAHERIHSSERPYACRICRKSFKTSECLWHHENKSKACGRVRKLDNHVDQHYNFGHQNYITYENIRESDVDRQLKLPDKNITSTNKSEISNQEGFDTSNRIFVNSATNKSFIETKINKLILEKRRIENSTENISQTLNGLLKSSEVRLFRSSEFGTILGLPLGHLDSHLDADAIILKKIKENYLNEKDLATQKKAKIIINNAQLINGIHKIKEINFDGSPPTAIVNPLIHTNLNINKNSSTLNSNFDKLNEFNKQSENSNYDFNIVNKTYDKLKPIKQKIDMIQYSRRRNLSSKTTVSTAKDASNKSVISLINMSTATNLLQSTAILMKKQHPVRISDAQSSEASYSIIPINEQLNNILIRENYLRRINSEEDILDEIHLDIDPYWDMGQQLNQTMSPMGEHVENGNITSLTSWEQELLADLRMNDVVFQ